MKSHVAYYIPSWKKGKEKELYIEITFGKKSWSIHHGSIKKYINWFREIADILQGYQEDIDKGHIPIKDD